MTNIIMLLAKQIHSQQFQNNINSLHDLPVTSYPTVTVYLQTHGSIKHHISTICSLVKVIFLKPETILVNIIFTDTLKIGFLLHAPEYDCDNKIMRPLITMSVCTHTVYHNN